MNDPGSLVTGVIDGDTIVLEDNKTRVRLRYVDAPESGKCGSKEATDYLTNYDFARAVVTRFGFNAEKILPIDLSTFFKGKIAKRAQYTWLDTAKSQKLLGPRILHTNAQSIDLFYKNFIKKSTS